MMVNDPIADMLTRIRNAIKMRYIEVEVPASKMKIELAKILKSEGYIEGYKVLKNDPQDKIILNLKYSDKQSVITGLKRISKPGLRVYVKETEIPRVLNGLGIAIISTSKGILTDKKAKELNVGGEVLAYIW